VFGAVVRYTWRLPYRFVICYLHFSCRNVFTVAVIHPQRIGAYQAANRNLEHPSHVHDNFVEQLFREYEANWGVSAAELCEVSFRTRWVLPILDAPVPSSPTQSGNSFNNGYYNYPHAGDVSGPSTLNYPARLSPYNRAQDPRSEPSNTVGA